MLRKLQQYQRLTAYTLVYSLTGSDFEAIWFNFHNTVLAGHREVRQAMAMAVDQQALIQARDGLARNHPIEGAIIGQNLIACFAHSSANVIRKQSDFLLSFSGLDFPLLQFYLIMPDCEIT